MRGYCIAAASRIQWDLDTEMTADFVAEMRMELD